MSGDGHVCCGTTAGLSFTRRDNMSMRDTPGEWKETVEIYNHSSQGRRASREQTVVSKATAPHDLYNVVQIQNTMIQ